MCRAVYVPYYFLIKNVFIFFSLFFLSRKKNKKVIVGSCRRTIGLLYIIHVIIIIIIKFFFSYFFLFSTGYGLSRQVDLFSFFSFAVCSFKKKKWKCLVTSLDFSTGGGGDRASIKSFLVEPRAEDGQSRWIVGASFPPQRSVIAS